MDYPKVYQKILQRLGPLENLLDIGCGDGSLVNFLAQKTKKKIIGLDISDSRFTTAKEKAIMAKVSDLIECVKGDVYHMKFFKDERFSVVTLLYTLHHLEDPEIALREIKRILKPLGKVLILDWVMEEGDKKGDSYDFFTVDEIQRMLDRAEFKYADPEYLEEDSIFVIGEKIDGFR